MDKIPKTFESYINKITQKVTYLDKYGGSVVVTGVILFAFFLIFSVSLEKSRFSAWKVCILESDDISIGEGGIVFSTSSINKFDLTHKKIINIILNSFIVSIYYQPLDIGRITKYIFNILDVVYYIMDVYPL